MFRQIKNRMRACSIALAWLLCTTQVHAQPTKAELIRGVIANYEAYKRLPSFTVTYQIDYTCPNGKRKFAFDHLDVANQERAAKYRTELNVKGVKENKNAEFRRLITWNGNIGMTLRENNGVTINTYPETLLYYHRYYFDYLNYPDGSGMVQLSMTDTPATLDEQWLPATLAQFTNDYVLLPATEPINGHDCYVLERAGREKLWIDPACGYLVFRRDLLWEDKTNLRHRTTADKPRNTQGFWHPAAVIREVYGNPSEGKELVNKVCGRFVLAMKGGSPNLVNDSEFMFAIPEGAMVADSVRRLTYKYKSGENGLPKETLPKAKEILRSSVAPSDFPWLTSSIGTAALLTVGTTWWLLRGRRSV